MPKHIERLPKIYMLLGVIGILISFQKFGHAENSPLDLLPEKAPETPIEKKHREAYLKYRMARMALQDGDIKLAHRFFHEALASNPKNGALRYEFALFLAKNGNGKEALETLDPFQGSLELTAKVEYLKTKINIASVLDGQYIEISKTQQVKGQGLKVLPPDGLLIISLGQIKWGQRIRNKAVTQTFSFPVHQLKSEATSYELKLTWQGIEKNGAKNYTADRVNPFLKAQRTEVGWAFSLHFEDANGGLGKVVFTPKNEKKKSK